MRNEANDATMLDSSQGLEELEEASFGTYDIAVRHGREAAAAACAVQTNDSHPIAPTRLPSTQW